jgi:inosose dehydratase
MAEENVMSKSSPSRREFLAGVALASAAAGCGGIAGGSAAEPAGRLHVAINQWAVGAVRGRVKQPAGISPDEELAGLAAAGLDGLEPGLQTADQAADLQARLVKHGLQLRSIYTGSALDDPAKVEPEIERIVTLAERARKAGTRIVVTNPNPLPNRQAKTDDQLRTQAGALDRLGRKLATLGLKLAYHNHDIELQNAAREFHHMMQATDPGALSLCLDAHWIYRGAGHSQVALFDVLKLYGSRISSLHLRQSMGNVWSETFGDGDIDYRALARQLRDAGIRPLLVPEQGPERGTPQTLEPAEVHRRSASYVREVFAAFAS